MTVKMLLALMSFAAAKTLALEAPLSGYGVMELHWNIEVIPGEPYSTLTGTVEQVRAEARKRNPDWDLNLGLSNNAGARSTNLETRGEIEGINCDDGDNYQWSRARDKGLDEGIEYLRRIPGKPQSSAGPKVCGRVSCSWDSAIWWCNDNDHPYELSSFREIGDAAAAIRGKCRVGQEVQWTKGQAFMRGNWNVIVRGDPVDC